MSSEAISEDVISRLSAAALSAPSCFNNQPWRFVFVDGEPELGIVRRHLSGNNYWAEQAPLIALVITDPDWDCRIDDDRDYALFDTGMATGYLVLQAVREGLVAHPIAGFRGPELKEALGINRGHVLVTCVILGYPGDLGTLTEKHRAAEVAQRNRRGADSLVFHNTWREELTGGSSNK